MKTTPGRIFKNAKTGFLLALVVTRILAIATAADFSLLNTPFAGLTRSSVVSGDFNRDGLADLLLTGGDASFNGVGQIWNGAGNGTFANANAGLPGVSSSAVARGDFDNDGRPDLLITGMAGLDASQRPVYITQLWRNQNDGTFAKINLVLPGVDTGAVALGDFNNDGRLDFVLSGYTRADGPITQIWRNEGNWSFVNINAGLSGVFYSSAAWGDYDNDGDLDLAFSGTKNGFGDTATTDVWRNQGNGAFVKANLTLPGVCQGATLWADFDNDGRIDILVSGYGSSGPVTQIWRNQGNGSFTNSGASLPAVYQSAVAAADYNNDGQIDVAISGLDSANVASTQILRNNGNGTFSNIDAGVTAVRYGSLLWADFEADGRLDLLLTGLNASGTAVTEIYHNNQPPPESPMPPQISSFSLKSDGTCQLSFNGQSGYGYTVWVSTDLVTWTPVGSANEGNPGTLNFTSTTTGDARRFYRLSRP